MSRARQQAVCRKNLSLTAAAQRAEYHPAAGCQPALNWNSMYTASSAFLEALNDAGVSYIFANLGSDHPGLVEALAAAKATGTPAPKVITCPNEMVAMAAAQGYAQISGRAQAVVVHVECGT